MSRPRIDDPPPYFDEDDGERRGPSLVEWGRLVLGGVWRRKLLFLVVLSLGLFAVVSYYRSKPPMYRVEASILAQQTAVARPTPREDAPTRSAYELIKRRSNLVSLIKQAGIDPTEVKAARGGLGLRRRLTALVAQVRGAPPRAEPPPTADDLLNELVLRLDRSLEVAVGEGTINIRLDWPSAEQAYRLVEAAQQNFLEARQVYELSALDEVISMLQGRTAALRSQVDRVTDEVQRGLARETAREPPVREAMETVSPAAPAREEVNEELVRLKSMIDSKERAIADVEEFRRRRLLDLQSQLDAQRGIYSDAYPAVVSLRQDIEAMERESPQAAALRQELKSLREEYDAVAARTPPRTVRRSLALAVGRRDPAIPLSVAVDQNERVREARVQYQQMLDRLNSTQVELDMARTAFKHRYNVIWPAEVPRKPFSPKPIKILGAGSLAVLLLALLAASAPDLLTGRIVQRWQVERHLELPVLAEINRR